MKKGDGQKARSKTEEGLWKLTPPMEIRSKRGFPPRLAKAAQTTLGFFTVSTSPTTVHLYLPGG
jgi:hypothetical protein